MRGEWDPLRRTTKPHEIIAVEWHRITLEDGISSASMSFLRLKALPSSCRGVFFFFFFFLLFFLLSQSLKSSVILHQCHYPQLRQLLPTASALRFTLSLVLLPFLSYLPVSCFSIHLHASSNSISSSFEEIAGLYR